MNGRSWVPVAATIVLALAATPGVRPATAPDSASDDGAAALMSRFATRIAGGNLELRSLRLRSLVTTRAGDAPATISQVVEIAFPDRIRRTTIVDGVEQALVLDHASGYIARGEQRMPLPDLLRAQASSELQNDLLALAAAVGRGGLVARTLPGLPEDDGRCRVVEVASGGASSRLCLTVDGTVMWQAMPGRHPLNGAPGTMKVWYSDFREVDGARYPFRHTVTFDDQELALVEITSLEINPDLPDQLFAIPPVE